MADDLKQTGKPDDARINRDQDHELAYWSKTLGVNRDELRKAIQTAGSIVKDVQRHLIPGLAMAAAIIMGGQALAGPPVTNIYSAEILEAARLEMLRTGIIPELGQQNDEKFGITGGAMDPEMHAYLMERLRNTTGEEMFKHQGGSGTPNYIGFATGGDNETQFLPLPP